jgi:hypothetical protein
VYRISIALASIVFVGEKSPPGKLGPLAVAPYTNQLVSNESVAAALGSDPWAHLPGWIVPNVLRVTTIQISNPVILVVLMKSDDAAALARRVAHLSAPTASRTPLL